ncbi:MAG: hypothetical protein ACTHOG_07545 [Marmoricola sp.]
MTRSGAWGVAVAAASLLLTALTVSPAGAAPAPGGPTTIGPGVQIMTPVGSGAYQQCTANFVYRGVTYTYRRVTYRTSTGALATRIVRVSHPHVYVGMAAHCVGAPTNSDTDTNGCTSGSLPLGTVVYFYQGVTGGTSIGGLVSLGNGSNGTRIGSGVLRYSSWLAMKKAHTTSSTVCSYNDLALVEVSSAYRSRVNPTVPYFGGPTKLAALPGVGASIYTVGNSSLRGTERSTSGKVDAHSTWTDLVTTSDPGVPGDSGSGYMNAYGQAVGVLSTLNCSDPLGLSCTQNGIGSLAQEIAFARAHWLSNVTLVPGTSAFNRAGAGHSTGGSSSSGGSLLPGLL